MIKLKDALAELKKLPLKEIIEQLAELNYTNEVQVQPHGLIQLDNGSYIGPGIELTSFDEDVNIMISFSISVNKLKENENDIFILSYGECPSMIDGLTDYSEGTYTIKEFCDMFFPEDRSPDEIQDDIDAYFNNEHFSYSFNIKIGKAEDYKQER